MNWIEQLSVGFGIGVLGVGCSANRDPATHAASDSMAARELSPSEAVLEDVNCGKDGFICNPQGLAFAAVAFGVSDACGGLIGDCPNPPSGSTTATLSQPELGKLCLAGTVKPGGWADLMIAYTAYDPEGTKVLQKFDAAARGITQAAFTLDTPPSGGVGLDAAVVTKLECGANPTDFCFTYGFSLMTAPSSHVPVRFTEPGPQIAPFGRFEQTRAGVSQSFDTTALEHVSFGVGPGAYDFCIHDFEFLDAAGNEVEP
jgi:hypothetical protein